MRHLYSIIFTILILAITGCNTSKKEEASIIDKTAELNNNQQTQMDNQAQITMDVAMKFMEAMGKGDMSTMVSLMDDNMVWQNEGDTTMPWIGPWKGKKVILEEFLPLFMKHFKTTKWETEDSLSSGDVAAFFGRMKGTTLMNNQETGEFTFALRVKVKNDKIILWNWLEDSYEVSQTFNAK